MTLLLSNNGKLYATNVIWHSLEGTQNGGGLVQCVRWLLYLHYGQHGTGPRIFKKRKKKNPILRLEFCQTPDVNPWFWHLACNMSTEIFIHLLSLILKTTSTLPVRILCHCSHTRGSSSFPTPHHQDFDVPILWYGKSNQENTNTTYKVMENDEVVMGVFTLAPTVVNVVMPRCKRRPL